MTHHEVVAALIVRSGMILLGRRSGRRAFYPDVWDLFGGHVEPGEQQPETLVRELQEELGITPTRWKFLETLTVSLPGHDHDSPELSTYPLTETSTASSLTDTLTVHLYLVTAWIGRPSNCQPEEHSAIGWFSLDQAKALDLADSTYPMLFQRHLNPP